MELDKTRKSLALMTSGEVAVHMIPQATQTSTDAVMTLLNSLSTSCNGTHVEFWRDQGVLLVAFVIPLLDETAFLLRFGRERVLKLVMLCRRSSGVTIILTPCILRRRQLARCNRSRSCQRSVVQVRLRTNHHSACPSKREIRRGRTKEDFSQEHSVGVPDMQAVAKTRIHITVRVAMDPIWYARGRIGESLPIRPSPI